MLLTPSNNTMATISIITPCYNVRQHIGKLILSLQQQNYADWELICVDDCSTDGTWEYLVDCSKSEQRLRIHQLEQNSGSAKWPRDTAASLSTSPWLVNIDADDWVEPSFLAKLIQRQQETGADIVCSTNVGVNEDGTGQLFILPRPGFDYQQLRTAEEAVSMTLVQWQFPMSGILIKADMWRAASNYLQKNLCHMNADELASREFLSMCSKVAFCNAEYYYRQHAASITHSPVRATEQVITDQKLLTLVADKFGQNSTTYKLAFCQYIIGLFRAAKLVLRGHHPSDEVRLQLQHGLTSLSHSDILSMKMPWMKKLRLLVRLHTYRKKLAQ